MADIQYVYIDCGEVTNGKYTSGFLAKSWNINTTHKFVS